MGISFPKITARSKMKIWADAVPVIFLRSKKASGEVLVWVWVVKMAKVNTLRQTLLSGSCLHIASPSTLWTLKFRIKSL